MSPAHDREVSTRRIRFLYGLLDAVQRRRVIATLDAALARQRTTAAEVERYAAQRLAALLAHARSAVPFYEERLAGLGGDPETLAGPAFHAIPPLEKAEIAEAGERLVARGRSDGDRGVTIVRSGGTTGVPTRIVLDRATGDAHAGAALRFHLWFGADPTRKHVMLWGPPPDENTYGFAAGRLKGRILGRVLLGTYGLTDEGARQHWQTICTAGRIEFVVGYSSALVQVAAAARPNHPKGPDVRRAVVAAAEPIFDFQRPAIAAAFGAPVRERYGCNEFSGIAHECRQGRLHVATDRVRLDLVREDGSPVAHGEVGEVLVTDLDNLHMPLLRYRIGDLAAWGDGCPCPLPFPVLARIHGRRRDLLHDPAGRAISPHHFAEALDGTAARGFQLRVDAARRVRGVDVVGPPMPLDAARERWRALAVGDLAVRFVAGIQRSRSGKLLPVLGPGE